MEWIYRVSCCVNGVVRGGSYYGDSTNGVRERSCIRVQARKANGQIVVGFRSEWCM